MEEDSLLIENIVVSRRSNCKRVIGTTQGRSIASSVPATTKHNALAIATFQPEKWPVTSSLNSTNMSAPVRTAAARLPSQHAKEVNLFRHSPRRNSSSPSVLIRHRLNDMSTRTSRRNRGHHRSKELHFSCWIALTSSPEELKVKQSAQTTRSPRPVTASTRKLSSQSASVHFVSSRRLQV